MRPSPVLRRRFLIALSLPAVLPALPAWAADPPAKRRLGVLWPGSREDARKSAKWLLELLGRRGWTEGSTLEIEWRYATGVVAQHDTLAKQLVSTRVDAIYTAGVAATKAAQRATPSIPIVTLVSDPVGSGFAKELARPGGNITGLVQAPADVARKQAELVKQLAPKATRVAIIHGTGAAAAEAARHLVAAAREAGLATHPTPVKAEGVAGALAELSKRSIDTAFIFDSAITERTAPEVAKAALRNRIAAFCHSEQHVMDGFLASLAQHPIDNAFRHAVQLDKIFHGTSPAQIAFEGPSRFHVALNRLTAAELGLAMSKETVFKADQVVG
jgi:putative ABC transport system substrate-binding protein